MRPSFSPTAAASRLLALRATRPESNPPLPAAGPLWCEWPRREPARRPVGIRQALLAIQARHA
ncbi:MAG TPA: hypothetical protein VHD61_14730 [Lacunisphaera sp.]|nr:hypothetical protein [Lacunisphaera sp.]